MKHENNLDIVPGKCPQCDNAIQSNHLKFDATGKIVV